MLDFVASLWCWMMESIGLQAVTCSVICCDFFCIAQSRLCDRSVTGDVSLFIYV